MGLRQTDKLLLLLLLLISCSVDVDDEARRRDYYRRSSSDDDGGRQRQRRRGCGINMERIARALDVDDLRRRQRHTLHDLFTYMRCFFISPEKHFVYISSSSSLCSRTYKCSPRFYTSWIESTVRARGATGRPLLHYYLTRARPKDYCQQ